MGVRVKTKIEKELESVDTTVRTAFVPRLKCFEDRADGLAPFDNLP